MPGKKQFQPTLPAYITLYAARTVINVYLFHYYDTAVSRVITHDELLLFGFLWEKTPGHICVE